MRPQEGGGSRGNHGFTRAKPAGAGGGGSDAAKRLVQRLTVPPAFLAEAACGFDRRAQVQSLVLRLLDQHDRLERVDVVDALLLTLCRDLRLVRPVVQLHLRNPCDLADLPEIKLHLRQMIGEIYRFKEVYLPTDSHEMPLLEAE